MIKVHTQAVTSAFTASLVEAPIMTNEAGRELRPTDCGITWWVQGGEWWLQLAWIHGPAIRQDGSVGSQGRSVHYRSGEDMPGWLREIAAAGPLRAEAVAASQNRAAIKAAMKAGSCERN